MSRQRSYTCPMCDGPVEAADYADDVLVCANGCGPVVYLGGRGADIVGSVSFAEGEDAPTLEEITVAALPYWTRWLARALACAEPGDPGEHAA